MISPMRGVRYSLQVFALVALMALVAPPSSAARADAPGSGEQPRLSSIPEGWVIVTMMPIWGPTAIVLTTLGDASKASNTDVVTQAQTASEAERRIIAVTAIEDAAEYYSTGRLVGVLPTALARIRELSPQARALQDAVLVDAIVQTADAFLR